MRLLDYPAQLLPHMAPWEVAYYDKCCRLSKGVGYLHWLIRQSGRYTQFKLKSDYMAEKYASVAMHALAMSELPSVTAMLDAYALVHGSSYFKLRTTLDKRTRLLLVCK